MLIYSVYLADALDLNIEEIIRDKMRQNGAKYPVDKSFGKMTKYNELWAYKVLEFGYVGVLIGNTEI
ncbi:MazG-like family protein [Paenibacillus rhizolycopersici]|uniref:MazG-like family protein n=1 Tax=Paenibacillus rhizolycopersici TaxID=2780073 RepID=UPI003D2B85AD